MRMRKVTLFAATETVYGTAIALTAADAMRTHEFKCTPFMATVIERKLDGQAYGNTGSIHSGAHLEMEFDVEMSGSGAAGTAPKYGRLLKACQMAETIVATTSVTYAPASSGTDSLTMYYQLDGQRHAMTGARGTWSIKFDSQGIPYIHFKFTGMWVDPTSVADLVPNFTGFTLPRPVSFAYTPKVSLFGLASVYKSFGYDHTNDVQFFDNPGEQFVDIVDRTPSGSISLLAPALSVHNYFTDTKSDTQGLLTLVHGMTAGNIVTFAAPLAHLKEPKYGDDKGRAMLEANLDFIYNAPDDEMSLAFT
ncbi:MAG: phage tail tube protein [Dokdonella sp.]